MNEEQEREAYWHLVDRVNEHIKQSGRSREEILEELEDDVE